MNRKHKIKNNFYFLKMFLLGLYVIIFITIETHKLNKMLKYIYSNSILKL